MKKILFVLIALICATAVLAEEAVKAPATVSPWVAGLQVFLSIFGGVFVTGAGLLVHKLAGLLMQKWHLEGLDKFEGMATDAVVKGIHYAESYAEQRALDTNGKIKPTGSEKFDTAVQYIEQILGAPFVKQYGQEKLEKLIESMLAKHDMGPAGATH